MKKIKKTFKKIMKFFKEFQYKEYANTNKLFLTFVISSLLNSTLLRFFTVKNYFAIKPILADLAIILLFGSFVYLFKNKKRFTYLLILSVIFTLVCIVNTLYYTYYMSFASFSLIAVSLSVVDVGDAVVENVLEYKDFLFLWQPILLIVVHHLLKRKDYYNRVQMSENRKKKFLGTLVTGISVYALFFMTVTALEYSRLSKQWNREFLVTKFGVYTYQMNDLIKSLDAKFNTLFGYDNAAKQFRDYYNTKDNTKKTNKYTGIFKNKNLIVIHGESMQVLAMQQQFNGKEVTPILNKMAKEGIYFSNFYSQVSSGTSSDAEFTFSTSLLPVTNGAVAVSYWNREYESVQKLFKEKDYNTLSFHGNNGDFWNRNNFHNSLGYNKFYSKNSYKVTEENSIGLGISDKAFFKQSTKLLKKEYDKNGKFMATLIMLSNHTPFSDVDKYGEFSVDIKEDIKETTETGETVSKTVSYPYMEGTTMGNYFKSAHYADSALGELITSLDEEGLLDNSVILYYGDHDARLPKKDYVRLYNYDKETDSIKDKDNEGYVDVDFFKYELDRKVPLVIWSKDKTFEKEVKTAMGMIDVMPTVSNMFSLDPKYNLGNDIMNLKDNIVVFPNGNWLSNDIYYNSNKNEYKVLNNNAVINKEEIDNNNKIASKKIEISNDIILYDLIKTEKDKLNKSEGE